MADPIPTTTVYITSDDVPVRTKEAWLARELFALLKQQHPKVDTIALTQITETIGKHYSVMKALIDKVEATQ